jgi:hypothetical protein
MKETFYDVAAFIEFLVIRTGVCATLAGRDHSHPTRRDDLVSERIRVVGLIAYHIFIRRDVFDQRRCLCDIVAISRCQDPPQGDPVIAEGQMKFRRESAARPSEGGCVLSSFFFGAPAAQE